MSSSPKRATSGNREEGERSGKYEQGQAGEEMIKSFEGYREKAYLCAANKPTIGWGHTKSVTQKDVQTGRTITKPEAQQKFQQDVNQFVQCVNRNVKVPLNQNQFDALVSLTYNIGPGNFKSSTLLRKLNQGDYSGASGEFAKWNKATVNNQLKVLAGLDRRRKAERQLFDQSPSNKVGGVELSLQDINLDALYGFNVDPVNKRLIALIANEEKEDSKEDGLSDTDSILKKSEQNRRSVMIWQHFCSFLKMFHEVGDREKVSFSLDPAERIEKGKPGHVPMKKVYFPENLRWSKAGEVMFDADLFIKTLLYDLHDDITKFIPNYESYVQRTLDAIKWEDESNGNDNNQNWHRLWIVLDELEESQEGNSFLINKIKFKINLRPMYVDEDGKLQDDEQKMHEDSLISQFVDHMNENMHILHQHSLFLQRLEGVFRALLLAKFVYTRNVPIDMEIIEAVCKSQQQELQDLGIVFEIPALVRTVEKSREITKGDYRVKQTRSHTFSGGIDLRIKPKLQPKLNGSGSRRPHTVSESGRELIKSLEGLRLIADSQDESGKAHIGYGHTKNVSMADVNNGKSITKEEAERLLESDLKEIAAGINAMIDEKVVLSQNNFDALASLAFNVGIDRLRNSTLVKELNAQNYEAAAKQFAVWNKVRSTVSKTHIVSKGLSARREKERKLFERPDSSNKVHKKLASLNKIFVQINQNLESMQQQVRSSSARFEKLCEIKNKEQTYTAVLFPSVLTCKKQQILCAAEDCKEDLAWSAANEFGGKHYCDGHYHEERYSNCTKCGDVVDKMFADEWRSMQCGKDGRKLVLHKACCVCFHCGKELGQNICGGKDGALYCSDMCVKKAAGFNEENAIKKCMKCQQGINVFEEKDIVQTGSGEVLHKACLQCDQCQKSLADGKMVMDHEKHMFCTQSCAHKYAMKAFAAEDGVHGNDVEAAMVCSQCAKEIAGSYVKLGDKFIHAECLKCDECGEQIGGGSTVTDGENHMFCSERCANKRMVRNMKANHGQNEETVCCHKCKKDILLTQEGVITLGKEIMLHRDCAVCFECGNALTGGVAMDDHKNIFCSSECGNSFHHQ